MWHLVEHELVYLLGGHQRAKATAQQPCGTPSTPEFTGLDHIKPRMAIGYGAEDVLGDPTGCTY